MLAGGNRAVGRRVRPLCDQVKQPIVFEGLGRVIVTAGVEAMGAVAGHRVGG